MHVARHAARTAALALGATGIIALTASSAGAHVTVTPSTTAAGAYTVLTFAAGHGCDGSPTTRVAFQIPDGIYAASPTVNPGWTIEKVMEKLPEPVEDGHGGEYTERVAKVVYTAKTPLPDGYRDTWELSLKLPDASGEQLDFPVVQTCEKGETAWVQQAKEGEDEPEAPAPFVQLTSAEAGDHHGGTDASDAEPASAVSEAADGDDSSGSGTALGWVGVVLGALGLGVGSMAWARTRARS